jgi:hypothetical protein
MAKRRILRDIFAFILLKIQELEDIKELNFLVHIGSGSKIFTFFKI